MKFHVCAQEICVLEEQKLHLPEACKVNAKRIGPGPVLAVGERDRECGPSRAVDLDGLVESLGGIVDDQHANKIDADRIVHCCSLVVDDAEDDAICLVHGEVAGIGIRVPAKPEKVELCEGLASLWGQDDVSESAACEEDTRDECESQGP